MNEPILRELDDEGVLRITLNRPEKKNAFNEPQWDGLTAALKEARADDRVACVLLTGAGDDFSSGQDLTAFAQPGEPREDGFASGFFACRETLHTFDKPIVAAAKGVAVGGGMTLLFICDVVYVGESVRLRLPFPSLGLVPELASSYLLQVAIGKQRAAELFFTAEWIDAARAVETGIAARSFPDDELIDAALAKAREIAQWPIDSLQATKRTLMLAHAAGIQAACEAEDKAMLEQAGSPANQEAIRAFLEKRKPDFKKLRPNP
ncbi:MAG: enoyl-CoA hydratase/isomerase family protein [Deltaproteobacteria bacterium]|nr:enoyl-CoA hydratase/isomerase family protein [Deltaproteobacteria bacterium]